jgi:hypothetical protein
MPTMTTVAIHRPVRPSRGVRHTSKRLKGPSAVTVSTMIHTVRIVPLEEAALAVAAVATVAVNRIQRMLAIPADLGMAHEPYPEVKPPNTSSVKIAILDFYHHGTMV